MKTITRDSINMYYCRWKEGGKKYCEWQNVSMQCNLSLTLCCLLQHRQNVTHSIIPQASFLLLLFFFQFHVYTCIFHFRLQYLVQNLRGRFGNSESDVTSSEMTRSHRLKSSASGTAFRRISKTRHMLHDSDVTSQMIKCIARRCHHVSL